MKKLFILLLFPAAVVFFSSCLTELPGVVFKDSGESIPVMGEKSKEGYTYRLKEPYQVTSYGKSVYLLYRSSREFEADISTSEGDPVRITLPSGDGGRIRYQLPVEKNFVIYDLTVKEISGNGDSFTLLSAGLEDTLDGYYVRDGGNGERTVVLRKGMKKTGTGSFSFSELSRGIDTRLNQVQIRLTYKYDEGKNGGGVVTLIRGDKRRAHSVILLKGGSSLYFYSGEEGFVPDSIEVTGFSLASLEVKPFSKLVPMKYKPVPADIGVMLNYPHKSWRRSDFEIFSWNLFPDFLLIDFKSYALQALTLKRLAFFLEKRGFAGTLLDNKKLVSLHGWNAHDYRAEDLALFFNTASEKNFILNPEEYRLLDILVSNGILKKEDGRFQAVAGGFLSYSRESSDRLRYLFITHEGYHGIYFSSPEYRRAVHEVWNSLSEEEKRFWKIFLNWKRYNIDDPYLVVNEFQAYLMQQKIENINDYYKNYIIPKIKRILPSLTDELDSFLEDYPDHFVDSAGRVEAALFSLYGITSGELRCVKD